MMTIHSFTRNCKRLIAMIALCLYAFLGISSPQAFSAVLLQLNGSHEVSISQDAQGHQAIVLHHHHLKTTQSDGSFHRHHRVEPDHIYLLPQKGGHLEALSSSLLPGFQIHAPPVASVALACPVPGFSRIITPQILAHPPPRNSGIMAMRRSVVLIL